jgi:hypothetical protein
MFGVLLPRNEKSFGDLTRLAGAATTLASHSIHRVAHLCDLDACARTSALAEDLDLPPGVIPATTAGVSVPILASRVDLSPHKPLPSLLHLVDSHRRPQPACSSSSLVGVVESGNESDGDSGDNSDYPDCNPPTEAGDNSDYPDCNPPTEIGAVVQLVCREHLEVFTPGAVEQFLHEHE